MKRNQIIFVLGLLICFSSFLSATVVIDSLYNVTGNWVINDSVYVTSNGIIQNSGSNFTLTINGGLANHGIIRDNPAGYNLYLEVWGHLANHNEWSCFATYLTGAGAQHISCGGYAGLFSSSYFYNTTGGNIVAKSNLYFVDCFIDFQNNGALDLTDGGDISVDGGYIYRTTIIGEPVGGRGLYMTNGAYLHSVTASDMRLSGIINIANSAVLFTGSLINNGIIQNSGSNFTLTIDCDITNNGTIKDNNSGYNLYLDITGDIINNGDWTNNNIEMTGTTDQHISCPSDSSFSVLYFYGNNSRANIYFDSDIEFESTIIDLNSDNVILQNGMTLTLSGGYMFDGTLTGTIAEMNMSGNNYIQTLTININDLDLSGTCQVTSGITINGDVVNNGYLQNLNGNHYILYLNGDLTNNGTVRNNPSSYNLSLDISGDIVNNGVWTNNDLELTGTEQHITCGMGNSFDIAYLYGNSSDRGNVYFDSDIGFNGTIIDLNADNIILQSGITLTLSGGNMFDGTLAGTSAEMNMNGNNYIYTLTINIEDLELSGTCQVLSGITINGDVVNTGNLHNLSGGHYSLYLNGDLTNNGTIRNSPGSHDLYLDISGDIVNNGVWTNSVFELTGTEQHITCGMGNSFDIAYLYGNSSDRGNVYFDSDIGFNGTIIDLNADNIILQSGITLTLSGGNMFDGTLAGTSAEMNMNGNNYIYTLTINIEDLELSGTCQVLSGITINGDVVNTGNLHNLSGGHYSLYLNGDLTNNGTIRNSPGSHDLYLDISGDIVNNGVWTNSVFELTGTEQHITCGMGNSFDIAYLYGNSSDRGNVYFDSDIGFNGTIIDLNADNIILQSGITLTLSGGNMFDGTLAGTSAEMNMNGNNYIYTLTINIEDLELSGTCQVLSGITINGDVVNTGNLHNLSGGHYSLYLNGNLTNNGTVRNSPGSHDLYVYISGDITNSGIWNNSITYLNGIIDQTITIDNPNEITGDVRFDSDFTGAPYQWKFDGTILDSPDFLGETSSQLNWEVPVASGWFGTFNCQTGGGLSRDIIITESGVAPGIPQNLTIEIVGTNVELDWDDVTGATSYKVYSDSDPYGGFGTTEWTGAVSEWSEAIPGNTKFYRVTASN